MAGEDRGRELEAAVAAVRAASELCARVQGRLLAGETLTKGDDSPVTVADFAAQAVVCSVLGSELGTFEPGAFESGAFEPGAFEPGAFEPGAFEMVGEEDAADLRGGDRAALLDAVVELVRHQLGADVSPAAVLAAIDRGRADGRSDRFWTLDPIDGTKGFLRGDQYAIALALVEAGEVVLGALGCPN
ncbi:MAG: inositol monophosphatase family protein, partial [Ilumatobacteraceae bacterium]